MRHRSGNDLACVLALVFVGAIATDAQTPPARLLYPPSDAAADIRAALARAKADGKHLLLDFGADWCPDCRVLGSLMESEPVAPFLRPVLVPSDPEAALRLIREVESGLENV